MTTGVGGENQISLRDTLLLLFFTLFFFKLDIYKQVFKDCCCLVHDSPKMMLLKLCHTPGFC